MQKPYAVMLTGLDQKLSLIHIWVQEILPSQVTVTLAGEHYPRSLHVFLDKAYGVHMEEEAPGIYYIKGLLFPLQIQMCIRDSLRLWDIV